MEWVQHQQSLPPRASVLADLARKAALAKPDSPWARLALANKEFLARNYTAAGHLYEQLTGSGIDSHIPWHKLARAYLEIGEKDAALRACQSGFDVSEAPDYELSMQAGQTLVTMGRMEEARQHFIDAAEAGNYHEACWFILFEYVRSQDSSAILDQCDALEARFGPSSVFRANRSIAFSLMGAREKAAALVNLDKHVQTGNVREFFDGDLEQFNAALAGEAVAIGADSGADEKTIVPFPDLSGSPAMLRLQGVIRAAIEAYLGESDQRGLEQSLPLPLGKAYLSTGATLLRRDGKNGQHIHMTSVISAVYHLGNPAQPSPGDESGALQIGPVDQYTGGHHACWGERRILPQPGQLTIFPAHFFHDVIPTRSDELRISFPSDVHLVD